MDKLKADNEPNSCPPLKVVFLAGCHAGLALLARDCAQRLIEDSLVEEAYNPVLVAMSPQPSQTAGNRLAESQSFGVSDVVTPWSAAALADADWVISLDAAAHESAAANGGGYLRWTDLAEGWEQIDPALDDGPELRRLTTRIERYARDFVKLLEKRSVERIAAPGLTAEDVEILNVESPYRGFFELQTIDLRHKLFGGGWTQTFRRELFVRNEVVCVLPYDPEADLLVLNEQFRIGALENPRGPWLIEMVAGMVEEGESLEDVAYREAREETGCELTALHRIGEYWVSPGGNNEKVHLYCGRVDAACAQGVHGLPSEHEDIRVRVMSVKAAFAALEQGIINNAATMIGLQWLQLNLEKLKQQWRAS